jgi:hypothetical protein
MRAGEVVDLLRIKYPLPAYAFLEQVADGTGARQNRWADAVAMSVWPSRGYRLYGFEVKVSRSDWIAELRNPEKADAMMQYCDGWYVVTGDASIVQPGELPPTWGHMTVKGGRLHTPTVAPQLKPVDFSPHLVASLLRNAVVTDANKVAQARLDGQRAGEESARGYTAEKLKNITEQVAAFELASGIHLSEYSGGKELGEAVGLLRNLKWKAGALADAVARAKGLIEGLEALQAVEAIEAVRAQLQADD